MTTCNRGEDIVAYLYDDHGDAAERRRFEEHLASCEACAREVAGLGQVRGHLAGWAPPDAALGFRIVQDAPAPPARVLPFRRWAAAGALAAAAVLVLAAAAALANLEVRYGADGVMVRTGWGRAVTPASPAPAAIARPDPAAPLATGGAAPGMDDWRAELARLERRLEEAVAQDRGRRAAPVAGSADDLAAVRGLIVAAEERQQRELALGLARLAQEFEVQRQADLFRVAQGIGRIETFTGAEAERQRAMLNHLLRVSQRPGQE